MSLRLWSILLDGSRGGGRWLLRLWCRLASLRLLRLLLLCLLLLSYLLGVEHPDKVGLHLHQLHLLLLLRERLPLRAGHHRSALVGDELLLLGRKRECWSSRWRHVGLSG